MSVTTYDGGRIVRCKKTRLRDEEALRERYELAWAQYCEGKEVPDVAKILGHSQSYVYRMFKRIPEWRKREIKRDVVRTREARLKDMAERLEAQGHAGTL